MDTRIDTTGTRANRDRTFAVLNALLNLGPGIHKFRTIAARSGLGDAAVHRRLDQLVDAGLATRSRRGYYELRETTTAISRASGLLHPSATPLLDAQQLLDALHHRTDQVVLLHTYSPLTGERLCIGAAGATSLPFRRELALASGAVDELRQAPLDLDAPGLVMLANLVASDAPVREDLRRIRAMQMAHSSSSIPGWSLVSVALRRLPGAPAIPGAEPGVVASVSVLAPEHSHGAHLVAYGRLMHNIVRAATDSSVVISRHAAVPVRAA
ncbi:helix-turn-helix domain-containing protein [Streptomyces erythrochromogenes]|uniref:helix-turn-helix domain-containing protein n=1 Tax=Streptomyces erythrochromogenes TaxID=285574 RepID=UPI00341A6268